MEGMEWHEREVDCEEDVEGDGGGGFRCYYTAQNFHRHAQRKTSRLAKVRRVTEQHEFASATHTLRLKLGKATSGNGSSLSCS